MHFAMANRLNALEFCIVKYTCRNKREERILDLEKAKHCTDMLIAWEKGEITAEQVAANMDSLGITLAEPATWRCTSCPLGCQSTLINRPIQCDLENKPTEWVKEA